MGSQQSQFGALSECFSGLLDKSGRQNVKSRRAKPHNPRMGQVGAESVPVAEAARLLGVSERTVKRMCSAGDLPSFRTAGGHVRVPRVDLMRFREGHGSTASAPASSVLQNRRERVEELGLEAQELRAKREIEKLRGEDSEAERGQTMEARAQVLAQRRALEEARLQREREAERRQRERRQVELERQEAEFRRRWLRWASAAAPDWLSAEQAQAVAGAVERALSHCDPEQPDDDVRPLLEKAIERVVAPWRAEREERARRENLIEQAVWRLPSGATQADKARAIVSARAALSTVPLDASDAGVRVALDEALAPAKQAIEDAQARSRREQLLDFAVRGLSWNATAADKAQATAAVRSALSNVPLQASRSEEQTVVAAAVAPIKRAIEERTAAQQEHERRERNKSSLVSLGVLHVSAYLSELYSDDEISDDAYSDYEWRNQLETTVRKVLESELAGDESLEDVWQIAREVVGEELEPDDA
ncbi:MAG: helix-turn-helix domain-containing protein [Acidobacteria bacterium]|nr:helix-turn-helix domain-containing protein [Acidobacteriota bacterium]